MRGGVVTKLWNLGRSGRNIAVIGEIAEEAVARGEIGENDLFDRDSLINDRTGLSAGQNTREFLLQTTGSRTIAITREAPPALQGFANTRTVEAAKLE